MPATRSEPVRERLGDDAAIQDAFFPLQQSKLSKPGGLLYSVRKARKGSILAARCAGSAQAASAIAMSTNEADPSVNGSSAEIP